MLKPPFSRPILFLPPAQTTPPTTSNETASDAPNRSSATPIRHMQPAAVRNGNTLARIKDDPDLYYTRELRTERLDEIKTYLWLAGRPSCARALHRQQLLGREILITEDPNEHLICKTKQLYEAACGFLLSYAWLVRHESDLRIAHEEALLPDVINRVTWTEFMDDSLEHIDLQSLSGISSRFQYSELRLSRLNKIYRLTRLRWRDFVRGYMTASTWYQDFFARNFAWLLAIFAVMSVALSAMQVVVAVARGGQAFENASYGFSVASLFMAAGIALVVLLLWVILFSYHLISAQLNDRQVMSERKSFVDVQRDLGC
ncbi:hypothetical protein BKA61DRAFT_639272 [Leptodontidium sp. MPI-SDFR-AT-0119]|nr:hypothetical protein BKA61DRAFT_639272 [Leptodontidium sp. MPI-SDFR-AT-0119]